MNVLCIQWSRRKKEYLRRRGALNDFSRCEEDQRNPKKRPDSEKVSVSLSYESDSGGES